MTSALGLPIGRPRQRVLQPVVSVFSSTNGAIGAIRPVRERARDGAPAGGSDVHARVADGGTDALTEAVSETLMDETLVAAVRAGERGADEQLYRRHAPMVLALATRLLRSRDEAMDVMQDTFVTAFEELANLREPAALRGWLQRVAVRLVHRRFRRRKLLALIGLDRREDEISLESLADLSACPDARAELRWIDTALLRVEERARVAWMLRTIDGLALDEVAAACECSLATAKRRIAVADAVVEAHLADQRESLFSPIGGTP